MHSKLHTTAVIGGGTLGMYVASRLADKSNVVIIEPDAGPPIRSSHTLFGSIENPGGHDGINTGWTSAWGGTSNLWGGQLLPWADWEFDGSVGAMWPITGRELAPHYEQVRLRLGLSAAHRYIHASEQSTHELRNAGLTLRHSTWMAPRERNMARNRSLRKTLRHVGRRGGWIVERVVGSGPFRIHMRSESGTTDSMHADRVVFAAGVIGTSKILAASYPELSAIGSGFMDHVSKRYARISVSDWSSFRSFAGQKYIRGVRSSPKILPSADFIKTEKINPAYAHWEFALDNSALLQGARNPRSASIATALREVPFVAESVVDGLVHRRRPLPKICDVYLRVDVEQRPAKDRRLEWRVEGTRRDLSLHWGSTEEEARAADRLGEAVLDALRQMDVGVEAAEPVRDRFIDTKHFMGGAVMGTDSATSVTDTHGRLHGTSDAWVVGAAVFPTGGMANPTFTALALSERTMDAIDGS